MPTTVRIEVVELDGEKLFHAESIWFDHLNAYDEFEGGKLTVYRDGQLVSETDEIGERGTHGACTCFVGMTFWRDGVPHKNWATNAVSPDRFLVGDVLELEIPFEEFNFDEFMRDMCAIHHTLIATLESHPGGVSLLKLDEEMTEAIPPALEQIRGNNLLRFLPSKVAK